MVVPLVVSSVVSPVDPRPSEVPSTVADVFVSDGNDVCMESPEESPTVGSDDPDVGDSPDESVVGEGTSSVRLKAGFGLTQPVTEAMMMMLQVVNRFTTA